MNHDLGPMILKYIKMVYHNQWITNGLGSHDFPLGDEAFSDVLRALSTRISSELSAAMAVILREMEGEMPIITHRTIGSMVLVYMLT